MICTSHHLHMLFTPPDLDAQDLAVIRSIEDHRKRLRHYLSAARRWNGQLRRNLRARAMRGSNSIEGYDISLDDAIAVVEGEDVLDADAATLAEVKGYNSAMTYVQQLAADDDFHFDESLVRSLHFMMLSHDLSKKPGSYRSGDVYVKDEDQDEVVYTAPDAEAIRTLMPQLLETLEHDDNTQEQSIFVTAAMAHLNLVMIHPFKDGNGRMARCLQTMILARNQILSPEFSSIEEWLGKNTPAYYDVLAATGQGEWNPQLETHTWVRFNLRAHHMQAQTVLRRVSESEDLWLRLDQLAATEGLPDRLTFALFPAAVGRRVRRPTYEEDAELEPGTAMRDLRRAVEAGLLTARGETKGRSYLGTSNLRSVYAEIRSAREKIEDPYELQPDSLGPRPRRRLATAPEGR